VRFSLSRIWPAILTLGPRSSRFFAKINEEFFQPRGLFCLVMTWNPQLADDPSTVVDLNSSIAKAAGGGGADMMSRLHFKFKSSDGQTYGDPFQEIAPLVFPALDRLASDEGAEQKISKAKERHQFLAGYLDRRANASFVSDPHGTSNGYRTNRNYRERKPQTVS
jgi:hypothetical protein